MQNANPEPAKQYPTNHFGWKVFFWLTAWMMSLGIASISQVENLNLMDYIDLIISVVTLIGLFGFAYYKVIGELVFWRYFFYVFFIESIIYVLIMPLFNFHRFGQLTDFGVIYLFELVYVASLLYALYQYAYRRPFIWN